MKAESGVVGGGGKRELFYKEHRTSRAQDEKVLEISLT